MQKHPALLGYRPVPGKFPLYNYLIIPDLTDGGPSAPKDIEQIEYGNPHTK